MIEVSDLWIHIRVGYQYPSPCNIGDSYSYIILPMESLFWISALYTMTDLLILMSHGFCIMSFFFLLSELFVLSWYFWIGTKCFSLNIHLLFPTPGISLTNETWSALKNNFPAIDEVVTKMQSKLRWDSILNFEVSNKVVYLMLSRLTIIYRKFR